jgi:hypothetical protein
MYKEKEYKRRLEYISEDVKRLSDVLSEEVLNTPVPNYENVGVVLSNIEIASNMEDEESSSWKTQFEIPTHDPQTGQLNPYYEELTGKKNPLLGKQTDEDVEFFHDYFGNYFGAKNINDSRIILRVHRYDGDNKFILSIKEYLSKGVKLTEKQILGTKKVFTHLDDIENVNKNLMKGLKTPSTKDKDIEKMPNQKWHQIISFIKSGVRIIGYCFIPFNLVLATVLLVVSEVIGIIEELV